MCGYCQRASHAARVRREAASDAGTGTGSGSRNIGQVDFTGMFDGLICTLEFPQEPRQIKYFLFSLHRGLTGLSYNLDKV